MFSEKDQVQDKVSPKIIIKFTPEINYKVLKKIQAKVWNLVLGKLRIEINGISNYESLINKHISKWR